MLLSLQDHQLQCHVGMLESFKADLSYMQENPPEGRKARAKELEELRVRAEYLQHEVEEVLCVKVCRNNYKKTKSDSISCYHLQMTRYEIYIEMLKGWKRVEKTGTSVLSSAELNLFDKAICTDSMEEDEGEEGGLKKSHSSPSLELDIAPPTVIKVRRNISERRTYRKTVVPRWHKEA